MRKHIVRLLPVITAAVLMAACGRAGKGETGHIYMPDMTYSNAYETYSASTITTPEGDNMSARKPVTGTIPRGYIPNDDRIKTNEAYLLSYMAKNHFTHTDANWQAEYDRAGASIKNPLQESAENLAEGKRLYEIQCKVCHGEKGEGNGQIVELPDGGDGPFTSRPPAYGTRLPQITDGNIFYSVSYGKGMMGAYAPHLSVNERWQVIQYIKSLAGIKAGAPAQAAATDAKAETKAGEKKH